MCLVWYGVRSLHRSVVFARLSIFEVSFAVRRWLAENSYLINRYLIAYLDLGNGVMANGTLNLHGSALLEQVAHHAAEFVVSPLKHDHSCHHRVAAAPTEPPHGESHPEHNHGRRRRDGDHDDMLCEPHKLLDEWIRNSNTQIGLNRSLNLVQMTDAESSAALAQLQYGIPSLLIEMTNPEVSQRQAQSRDLFLIFRSDLEVFFLIQLGKTNNSVECDELLFFFFHEETNVLLANVPLDRSRTFLLRVLSPDKSAVECVLFFLFV